MSEDPKSVYVPVRLNRTVMELVKASYYEAKQDLASAQLSLTIAVNFRSALDTRLVQAKSSEADAAKRCQDAADRLKDLKAFLEGAFVPL